MGELQGIATRLLINTMCALWLWMFIHPMTTLGLLNNPNSFAFVFFIMLLSSLIPSKWIQVFSMLILNGGYALFHFRDIYGSIFARILRLVDLDSKNISDLLHGQTLAEPLQTQLFICIVYAVFWLLIFASRRRSLWVFYNLLGLIVLCIIDVATAVHPTLAIVVDVGVCLVVLALARIEGRQSRSSEIPSSKRLLPTFMVILLLLGVGFASPKQGAVWGNPLDWKFPSVAKGTREVQVIGFQADDSRLGGSFVMNYDPVFSVVEPFPEYLRGQVLSTYTGKGWMNSSGDLHSVGAMGVPVNEQTSYTGLPEHQSKQDFVALSNTQNTDVVFGAYSISSVEPDVAQSGHPHLEVDDSTGTVTGLRTNQGESYQVVSRVLVNPYPQLKDLPDFQDANSQLYPMDVGPFLELPAELPSRVRELAQKVAAGGGNEYDIVTRIENFLSLNYTYDTRNVPVPTGKTDYVDQFLFNTKRGYCNNFSTTMAVMLRAVNIPTRWVTGFAEGEPDDTYQGSDERYIVRNADAHSWVEVYFPHYGWIPFDPTPSFSFPFAPAHVKTASTGPANPQTSPSHSQTGTRTSQNHHPPSSLGNSAGGSDVKANHPTRLLAFVLLLVAGIVSGLSYLLRNEIRLRLYQRIWRKHPDEQRFIGAIRLLLRLSRKSDTKVSTLRDLYDVAQKNGLEGQELRRFIQIAEGHLYGRQAIESKQWKYLWETWRKWIRNLVKHSKSN